MVISCVAYGCNNKQTKTKTVASNEYIAFHRFPLKDQSLLLLWEKAVNREEPCGGSGIKRWRASQYSYICSKHFLDCDYSIPPSASGTCRLKDGAVPSVFPAFPSYYRSEPKRLRKPPKPRGEEKPKLATPHAGNLEHSYAKVCVTSDEILTTSKQSDSGVCTVHNRTPDTPRKQKLKRKVRTLQQKVRRRNRKIKSLKDVICDLKKKLLIAEEEAQLLHNNFDSVQLSLFTDSFKNSTRKIKGRRYSKDVKEFALTLYYYSPKAYKYVRSILLLPNPSLIRKWSLSVNCEPGFLKQALDNLAVLIKDSPSKKDCALIIDAMAIRKQTIFCPVKNTYVGFVDYGSALVDGCDTVASEALVFVLVGLREPWKLPIGYFLTDKANAKVQSTLITIALQLTHQSGLNVRSVTCDGTTTNLSTFSILGCKFDATNYDEFVTKFKHPCEDYSVCVILDPCHMIKLARNALGTLGCFKHGSEVIKWDYIKRLSQLQEKEGLSLANKLNVKHIDWQKHKMNVSVAAQTLSASVAQAISFLDIKMKVPDFQGSSATVKFIQELDRLFDILNSRNPFGKGFKQPLHLAYKSRWENVLKYAAKYLLELNTMGGQKLVEHRRKTFVVGFVITIKSIIYLATTLLTLSDNPFKYVLTYRFSQDHIELLFSCIRGCGGWNNNPNVLQLKYALRKLLMKNSVKSSHSANCVMFDNGVATPLFSSRKHSTPLRESTADDNHEDSMDNDLSILGRLSDGSPTEFKSNILYYIAGYIVRKLTKLRIECNSCCQALISSPESSCSEHSYSLPLPLPSPARFTAHINNGGLIMPSNCSYKVVVCAEKIFTQTVCGSDNNKIVQTSSLLDKMVAQTNNELAMSHIFSEHEPYENDVCEERHKTKLIKLIATHYLKLRLYSYGKMYTRNVLNKGQASKRHVLTKLVLFRNQ